MTKESLLRYLESHRLVNQIVIDEARKKTPAQRLRTLDDLYLSGLSFGWFASPYYLLVVFFLFSSTGFAQVKGQKPSTLPARAGASGKAIEPPRVTSGLMTGKRIAVRESDWLAGGKPAFDLRLESARISGGRLEFISSYREPGKGKTEKRVEARLVSTMARSANPWPGATSSTARDRRPQAARERAEVNEQTQSLYSAAEIGSGCELLFLVLQPPGQGQAVQIGVVLAHQDNEAGNEINQAVCRVTAAIRDGSEVAATLAKLNQLLAQ